MLSSSSARKWAIASITAGALVVVGFSVPWFFASDASSVRLVGSGWQVMASLVGALLQGSASPFLLLMLALLLLLVLAALFLLIVGASGLSGRGISWMGIPQIIVAGVGIVAAALEVGFAVVLFYALANFDVPDPNAALIPGIGCCLMLVGFLIALVGGILFLRARRQQTGGTAPTS